MYCRGEDTWKNQIQLDVMEFLESVQTDKSELRSILSGGRSTVAAVVAAFFVGWALTAVAPQSVVHYYPNITDAVIFTLGSFGLMVVRFRNWIHPLVKISDVRSHPTNYRLDKLAVTAVLLTIIIMLVRCVLEGGPFIRPEF
jgi:hypothetical protein